MHVQSCIHIVACFLFPPSVPAYGSWCFRSARRASERASDRAAPQRQLDSFFIVLHLRIIIMRIICNNWALTRKAYIDVICDPMNVVILTCSLRAVEFVSWADRNMHRIRTYERPLFPHLLVMHLYVSWGSQTGLSRMTFVVDNNLNVYMRSCASVTIAKITRPVYSYDCIKCVRACALSALYASVKVWHLISANEIWPFLIVP